MKHIVALLMVAVLAIGAQSAFANSDKCSGKAKSGSCPSMDKLNLTADQMAKVEALCADCKKGKCDKASMEKMDAGMKEILTADQYKQWTDACKAQCAKGAKSGCCAAKKDVTPEK